MLFSGSFSSLPELKASGIPETLDGFKGPPMGGDLNKLVVLTAKLATGGLPIDALALCMLDLHAGSSGFAGNGFGDSGLANAVSSQLDFVGLQRRESRVFVGTTGNA